MNSQLLEVQGATSTIAQAGADCRLVDAAGRPLAPARPDPQALALAALERDHAALLAENARLKSALREYEVETLVELAIAERRLLPMLREYAMSMGRRDIDQLKAFVISCPPFPEGGSK